MALVTAVITAGWAVALVVLALLRADIPASARWWIWTCAVGVGLGLFGLWYVPRVRRARGQGPRRSPASGTGRGGAGES